jgi:hypothetical protein
MHKLFIPKQAVGANLVYFDFFNPLGSSNVLKILSVVPVVSGAADVAGTLGVDLFLTRTTAVGTGGTAATIEGTGLTAATFAFFDNSQPIVASQMSARLTPSGGATAGAVLGYRCVFTEDTNSASYVLADLVCAPSQAFAPLLVNAGTGIRVVQGSVASVGNIGFDISFTF